MPEPIAIRPALAEDAPALSAMICDVLWASNLADYGPTNIARVASHFTPEGVVEMLNANRTLIAETAGELIGTIGLRQTDEDTVLSVRTLFVRADLQRQGVGSRLYEAILQDRTFGPVTQLTVRSSIAAEKFYAAKGFVTVRDHWDGDERTIEMQRIP